MRKDKNNYLMHGVDAIKQNEELLIFNSNEDTTLHKHDFIELVYFRSGIGHHYIDNETLSISNGTICLINTDVEHYYEINNEKNGAISVKNCIFFPSIFKKNYISSDFIMQIWRDIFPLKLPEKNLHYIQIQEDYNKDYLALINIIEHEYTNKQPEYMNVIIDCLRAIFLKMFRDYLEKTNPHSISLKNLELIEQSLRYISQYYAENLLLDEVAASINFSPIYYNNLLRKYTGLTFRKYLQKTRCEKACQLLKDTTDPIYLIAEKVGYLDLKQFFFLFKKYIGITPNAYRKKHMKALLDARPQSPSDLN